MYNTTRRILQGRYEHMTVLVLMLLVVLLVVLVLVEEEGAVAAEKELPLAEKRRVAGEVLLV